MDNESLIMEPPKIPDPEIEAGQKIAAQIWRKEFQRRMTEAGLLRQKRYLKKKKKQAIAKHSIKVNRHTKRLKKLAKKGRKHAAQA